MTYPPSLSEASNVDLPILGSKLRPIIGGLIFFSAVVLVWSLLDEAPVSPLRPQALKSNAVNNWIRIFDIRLVVELLTLLSVKLVFSLSSLFKELRVIVLANTSIYEIPRIQSFFAKCFVEKQSQAICWNRCDSSSRSFELWQGHRKTKLFQNKCLIYVYMELISSQYVDAQWGFQLWFDGLPRLHQQGLSAIPIRNASELLTPMHLVLIIEMFF